MNINEVLAFPAEEYTTRVNKVRETMKKESVDLCIINTPENIYYLSGFTTRGYYTYQALILPSDKDPILVVRRFERKSVETLSWVKDSVVYEDTDDPIDVVVSTLKDLQVRGKDIGIEKTSSYLSVGTAESLARALPASQFCDCSGFVEAVRAIKSQREIEYIRNAAGIVSQGMKAALFTVEVGKTENDIAAEMYRASITAGSEYMAGQPYVASGPRSGLPHATWSGRELREGDVVYLEQSSCVRRYGAALIRTAILGSPDDRIRRASDACIAGLNAAIEAIQPGSTSGDIDAACRSTIERAGFGDAFIHRTGYSIGIGISPAWGEGHIIDLKRGDPRTLDVGMCFHLVPIVFLPSEAGIGFSETVLVTATGHEVLTSLSRSLFVK